MVDSMSSALRSQVMSRIRAKDTRPEMIVRRMLHKAGYRYRLHDASLPGKPDLVFAGRRKVIFVHGCFWHLHSCARATIPKSRVEFWTKKLNANRERDNRNLVELRRQGWSVFTVWECQLSNPELLDQLIRFLG